MFPSMLLSACAVCQTEVEQVMQEMRACRNVLCLCLRTLYEIRLEELSITFLTAYSVRRRGQLSKSTNA